MSRDLVFKSLEVERVEVDGDWIHQLIDPNLRDLPGPELAVHRALLWHLNDETGRCDPSHAALAADSGSSPATVKRALEGLREKGLWTWTGKARRTGRGRDGNSYELTVGETKRSDEPIDQGDHQQADQQINSDLTNRSNTDDQLVTLTKEQERNRKKNTGSPGRSGHAGAREGADGKDDHPPTLVSQVCSILQGGIDGLPENDLGLPWPNPKPTIVAQAIGKFESVESVEDDVIVTAARAAREIAQAQDRAPNISSLFAQQLEKQVRDSVRGQIHGSLAAAAVAVTA